MVMPSFCFEEECCCWGCDGVVDADEEDGIVVAAFEFAAVALVLAGAEEVELEEEVVAFVVDEIFVDRRVEGGVVVVVSIDVPPADCCSFPSFDCNTAPYVT